MPKKPLGLSTRDHIIAIARHLFAAHGYAATSTEKVLEESGASRGALYHHFENKEALFAAVLEAVEKDLSEIAARASAQHTDPIEGLRAAFGSFLRMAREPEVRQIVLVDAHSVVGWQKWREIEERYGLGQLKKILGLMAAAGRIPLEQVELYAHILLATLVEVAFLISQSLDPEAETMQATRAINRLLDQLLSG